MYAGAEVGIDEVATETKCPEDENCLGREVETDALESMFIDSCMHV
jgi:hypothetical protein